MTINYNNNTIELTTAEMKETPLDPTHGTV